MKLDAPTYLTQQKKGPIPDFKIINHIPIRERSSDLEKTDKHGTGCSRCHILPTHMIKLNNDPISYQEMIDFLGFIGYSRPIDIHIKKITKRNWGKSNSTGRWIMLRRQSAWVFLHELAHQFVPGRGLVMRVYQGSVDYRDILPPSIGKIQKYEAMMPEKLIRLASPKALGKNKSMSPHGALFGEILTHLTIAWMAFKGELKKGPNSELFRGGFRGQYESAIKEWMKDSPKGKKNSRKKGNGSPRKGAIEPILVKEKTPNKKDHKIIYPTSKAIAYVIYLSCRKDRKDLEMNLIHEFIGVNTIKMASLKKWVAWWNKGEQIPRVKESWNMDEVIQEWISFAQEAKPFGGR